MMNAVSEPITINKFSRGDVIVHEGAESLKHMIVVLQGNVSVYKHYKRADRTFIRNIGPGDFHSELSLFLGCEQSDTLVAMSEVTVSFITRKNLNEFFAKYSGIAISVVEKICGRLEEYMPVPEVSEIADNTSENTGTVTSEKIENHEIKIETPSGESNLFPDGHGSYTLPLSNESKLVYCTKSTCPLCEHSFDNLGILMSRLRRKGTDPDSRERYFEVEPIYYDIITCPECLFSADFRLFSDINKKLKDKIYTKVAQFKKDTVIEIGRDRDTFTVFAGYYLAMLCSPVIFDDDYQTKTGGLWLKLSRLYSDCGDKKMERFALEKSFEAYQYAYMHLHLPEEQGIQVCYMLGELNYKLGNLDDARNSYYAIKTNTFANLAVKRKAERRMDEIREILIKKKESEQSASSAKEKKKK